MSAASTTPFAAALTLLALLGLNACDRARPTDTETVGVSPPTDPLCPQKTPKGLCIVGLGVGGATPVRFEAQPAHMQRLADGSLQISDELVLVAPKVRWTLTEAKVVFKPAPGGGFDRIEGEARVPFDQVPILEKAKTGGGMMAALGYDEGKNLSELDAPLQAETHYLFFVFKENFGVSFGFDDLGIPVRGGDAASKPFSFSPIPEAKLVMALDASDPFFYVSAKGLSSKKKKENKKDPDPEEKKQADKDKDDEERKKKPSLSIGGFGYSYHGRIPEAVSTPDFSKNMTGNLVLEGSVPFPPVPVIQYAGFYLVRQDAMLQAISGDISLGFPLKLLTSFNISLGDATAIAEVNGEHAEVLMAGRFQPDTSWVPAIIPLFPEEDVRLAVRLDTQNQARNFVHGEGSFAIAGSAFAPKGLQFGKVLSQEGEFRITLEQIVMQGGLGSDLSPFKFGADTHFDAVVAAKKQDNRLGINGNILIGALDTKGKLAVTPQGVQLDAQLNGSDDWQMAFKGKLHNAPAQGLMFSGDFEVPRYLDERVAKAVSQEVEQTTQDLKQQVANLTQQLETLNADLPSVRDAARKAAELALWNMDTKHDGALVNKEIARHCKSIPGCKGVAESAYNRDKQVKKVKAKLNDLIDVLKRKDDRKTRAALRAALEEVIESNPVSVDFKVHKAKVPFLDSKGKQKLQSAKTHIEELKSTGGKQVNTQKQLESFTQGTLNQVAQQIKQGANPIAVKSIDFEMPATQSGPISLTIVLALNGKPRTTPLAVSFDPKQPQQLPMAIVKKL